MEVDVMAIATYVVPALTAGAGYLVAKTTKEVDREGRINGMEGDVASLEGDIDSHAADIRDTLSRLDALLRAREIEHAEMKANMAHMRAEIDKLVRRADAQSSKMDKLAVSNARLQQAIESLLSRRLVT